MLLAELRNFSGQTLQLRQITIQRECRFTQDRTIVSQGRFVFNRVSGSYGWLVLARARAHNLDQQTVRVAELGGGSHFRVKQPGPGQFQLFRGAGVIE